MSQKDLNIVLKEEKSCGDRMVVLVLFEDGTEDSSTHKTGNGWRD